MNWHLYLPGSIAPLALTGRGSVGRVGPLRDDPVASAVGRVLGGLAAVAGPGVAYAGEGYESSLASRRKVYERERRTEGATGGDPFPLVGVKHRLRGVLLDT
ncbi:MAG: hypothetical protein ABMB14_32850, partial [Myxococcota bacterium]